MRLRRSGRHGRCQSGNPWTLPFTQSAVLDDSKRGSVLIMLRHAAEGA